LLLANFILWSVGLTAESNRLNFFKTAFSRVEIDATQKAFESIGVAVKNQAGDLRPVGDIYGDIANKWATLTREQKMYIATQAAGRWHITRFLALMDNYKIAVDATTTSQQSFASALEENYKHQRSLESQINKLQAAWEELSVTIGKSGVADAMSSGMGGLTLYIKGMTELIGNNKVALVTMTSFATVVVALTLAFNYQAKQAGLLNTQLLAQKGVVEALKLSWGTLGATVVGVGNAIKAAFVANLPLLAITALLTAIPMLVGHFKQLREEQELLNKTYQDSIDKLNEMKQVASQIGSPTLQMINDNEAQIRQLNEIIKLMQKLNIEKTRWVSYGDTSTEAVLVEATMKDLNKETKDRLATYGIQYDSTKKLTQVEAELNGVLSDRVEIEKKMNQNSTEYQAKLIDQANAANDYEKSILDLINDYEELGNKTNKTTEETLKQAEVQRILSQVFSNHHKEIMSGSMSIIGILKQEQTQRINLSLTHQEQVKNQLIANRNMIQAEYEYALKAIEYYSAVIAKLEELRKAKEIAYHDDYMIQMKAAQTEKIANQVALSSASERLGNIDKILNSAAKLSSPKSGSSSGSSKEIEQYKIALEGVNAQLNLLKAQQELLAKSSDEYTANLRQQIILLTQKQNILHEEADRVRAGRSESQLKDEEIKKVRELQTEWQKYNKEISDIKDNIQNIRMDNIYTAQEKQIKLIDTAIDRLKDELSLLEELSYEDRVAKVEALNNAIQESIATRQQHITTLEQEQLALIAGSSAWTANAQKILESKEALEAYIYSQQLSLKQQLSSLADQVISLYKEIYEKQKDIALKAIDDQIEAEDERHENIIDNLEKEADAYKKAIQEQIDAIRDAYEEENYQDELNKLQKERQDIVNKINILSLDTSPESKAKIQELQEDLAKTEENIEKKKSDHLKDTRIDALNDLLDIYEEQVKAKKEAEEEKLELTKEYLDRQKEEQEKYYDDLINNESYYQNIRRQILEGNFDQVQADFARFRNFFITNSVLIGKNLSDNIIKQMDDLAMGFVDVIKLMEKTKELSESIKYGETPSSPSTPTTPTTPSVPTGEDLWQKIVSGDFSNKPVRSTLENNGIGFFFNPATTPGGGNSTIDTLYGVLREGTHYRINPNDSRAYFLHEGGIVGNETKVPSRVLQLVNTLLNKKPNEQVVMALKDEIFAPSKNIMNNFIPNIKSLIGSLTPQAVLAGGNNVSLNVYVDKLNANSTGDVNKFFSVVANKLNKMGR
jgi:hypothetical protein